MTSGTWRVAALCVLANVAQLAALHSNSPVQAAEHSAEADVQETAREDTEAGSVSVDEEERAERPVIVEIKPTKAPKRFPFQKAWDYLPNQPRLGIVTGAPRSFYERNGTFGEQTAKALLTYARRKSYAFYVNRDMGSLSDRDASWNKIIMMYKYMDDVPLLVWVDPDILVTNPEASLENLLRRSLCDGAHQSRWEGKIPKEQHHKTWLWLAGDVRPGGNDQLLMNANDGMMMVRTNEASKNFLSTVWNLGEDPKLLERHSYANTGKIQGWPYENGAIWETLVSDPEKYLRDTCVVPSGVLFSKWTSAYAQFGRKLTMKMPGIIRNTFFNSTMAKMEEPIF